MKTLATPGLYCDGAAAGLYLLVRDAARKYWVFRYSKDGRAHELGLGPAASRGAPVTLAEARDKAAALRQALRAGRDPLAEKRLEKLAASTPKTFDECASAYIEAHSPKWRTNRANDYKAQWESSLRLIVAPVFGKLPVGAVNMDHVLKALKPIWETKHPTARNLQNRIERILNYAIVHKWRSGPNPAKWAGNLSEILPTFPKVRHHAAMPYVELPEFMRALKADASMASCALRLLILTAARSGEVRGMTFDELQGNVWTVPAARMKKGVEHRVPLSEEAQGIIAAQAEVRRGQLVFPGTKGQVVSDLILSGVLKRHGAPYTVHGFRSTFRDWSGDESSAAREIAEAALAHKVGDSTEQAYRRKTALKKRAVLMQAWANFCGGSSGEEKVVRMRRS